MSRHDSDSRHHHSRLDREPSPKRVRRDGKTTTERAARDSVDRDQKHHRRLQDSHLLVVPDSKIETVPLNKESNKKSNGYCEGIKISSDNIEAPRSRSHFQHDERAGQVGRSFRHREATERESWKDLKDRQRGRASNRSSNNDNDTKPRDEQQPSKIRPSFQETRLPVHPGSGDKSATTEVKKIPGSERKEERGKPLLVDRPDRHRTEMQRMKFRSRDRHGGSSFRGRDRFNGQSGGRPDKWKHDLYDETNNNPTSNKEEDLIAKDLYDETNNNPTSNKEEDLIAKVEALLAS